MDQIPRILKGTLRTCFITGAVGLVVWSVFPEWRTQAAGFLLGLLFSLINGWYLAQKTRQVSEIAAENNGRRAGLGFFIRAALSILAVGIAVEKEQFDVMFTIIGLLYVNVAMVIVGVFTMLSKRTL